MASKDKLTIDTLNRDGSVKRSRVSIPKPKSAAKKLKVKLAKDVEVPVKLSAGPLSSKKVDK